ncbi:MAG TPA: FAD-dependent oxidoreductase [Methanocella sp.]|nr:FAD-dependent oxidoreductase [Methanocella sp.]
MTDDTIYGVGIIGAGPAGLTAALYCGRANLSTVMFGDVFDSQLAKAGDVENYPGFESIRGIELAEKFSKQLEKYAIKNVPSYVRRIIRKDDIFIFVTDAGEFSSKSVIVSTGSKHRELNIPGEKEYAYRGVSYCAVCDGSFYKNKKVALIGSGDQAASAAIYLAGLAKAVLVLTSKPDMDAPVHAAQLMALGNVNIVGNASVLAIEGNDYAEHVVFAVDGDKKVERIDGIFIEGGVPNSILARDLGLEIDGKGNVIVSRPDQSTKVEGVFAAGDVTGGLHQISKAVGEGACAAVSAAIYLKKKYREKSK